jgi:RNA polymerase sigma-70 factor (ECF subfamily)
MKHDGSMPEYATRLSGAILSVEDDLEREFEAQLVESSTLAFRVAFGVLRQREDAEDVAQEAFAKAFQRFRALRDRDRFRAWLVRMTWRLAMNRRRSDRRRVSREMVDVEPSARTMAADTLVARERAQQLWSAIDALPEKLRVVIVLAGIEGHDIREVARLLGLPEGTVKSRLFLGRQRLREVLQWTNADPTVR